MNYEEKYNEALEVMRQWIAPCHTKEQLDTLKKSVFPELAESEDERIRKFLVVFFASYKIGDVTTKLNGVRIDDILAYLEKQKAKEKQQESLHIPETSKENANSFTDGIIEVRSFQRGIEEGRRLEKQKEQKPALIAENDNWYICIKDFYAGGKKWASVGDLVQAKNGMYMMGRDDISEWFRRAYYEEVRDAFEPNTDVNIPEQKPAEWSEEDEKMLNLAIEWAETMSGQFSFVDMDSTDFRKITTWLKSLRPSWKPTEEQMKALRRVVNKLANTDVADSVRLSIMYDNLKKL